MFFSFQAASAPYAAQYRIRRRRAERERVPLFWSRRLDFRAELVVQIPDVQQVGVRLFIEDELGDVVDGLPHHFEKHGNHARKKKTQPLVNSSCDNVPCDEY